MNDPVLGLPLWIWIVIAVVVVVIIIVAVVVGRGKGEVRNRERAAELRERASQDEDQLASRQQRADELAGKADTARERAMTESERADALRVQAGESDELAAKASQKAEMLDDEAARSREALREAEEEHEKVLREADRRDPDVHTDRHGNRIDEATATEDRDATPNDTRSDGSEDPRDDVLVFDDTRPDDATAADRENVRIPEDDRTGIDERHRDDEAFVQDDRTDVIDPSHDDGAETTPVGDRTPGDAVAVDDDVVIPEAERLDADDDYSRDEFAEPAADFIDPVEHDRMAQQGDPVVMPDSGTHPASTLR